MNVTVVVLNWKGASDTIDCLDSLLACVPRPDRVIVVDNGSRDDSVLRLRGWAERGGVPFEVAPAERAPADDAAWLTILPLDENRGFSGGNNAGIVMAALTPGVDHVLLLNNDATVAPDFFAELGAAVRASPGAGLYAATIYEFGDRTKVWYAGGVSQRWRAMTLHRHEVPAAPTPVDTEFVTGCVMLMPLRTVRLVGLLPEVYFPGYFEDSEYSARVRRAGLRLLYCPSARAYHKVAASFGLSARSPRVTYVLARHRVFYARRNVRGLARFATFAYLLVVKPARALVDLLRGHPRQAWATLAGTAAGAFGRAARRPPPRLN